MTIADCYSLGLGNRKRTAEITETERLDESNSESETITSMNLAVLNSKFAIQLHSESIPRHE